MRSRRRTQAGTALCSRVHPRLAGLASVLSGLLNRRTNELHAAFGAAAAEEAEQLRLLACRPELAAQKDPHGNLPLHAGASAGASLRAVDECARTFPDAPRTRNADGFMPHQLALEHGHRELAELLALRAGKALPSKAAHSELVAPAGQPVAALGVALSKPEQSWLPTQAPEEPPEEPVALTAAELADEP